MRLLIALVILGVLVPTGAVLWFMNEAARSQAEAARQNVAEAYRGQMRLVRDRVDTMWRMKAEALDKAFNFPTALQGAAADAVVLLDAAGEVVYPVPSKAPADDPLLRRPEWAMAQMIESRRDRPLDAAGLYAQLARDRDPSIAARAAQAQIRCLLAAGKKDAALAAIKKHFSGLPLTRGRDPQGRSIAADEQLLALHLQPDGDPAPLKRLLWSFDSMPTAQRLFLMRELHGLVPEQPPFQFEEAERLALEYVELEKPRPGPVAIEATRVPDVWRLTSTNRRVIALFRTPTVAAYARREFGSTKLARFAVTHIAPEGGAESIAAGATMPGWQFSYTLDKQAIDGDARRHGAIYLSVGYAVVATLVLIGLFLGGAFARQVKLARLKTDLVAAVSHELKTPLASMRLLVDSLLEDASPDPKKSREYLELISSENLRLTRLIDNFLTFSRIERNRQRFEFAPTNPARVVEAAVKAARERWPGCAIEADIAPELQRIPADEDALVTVLMNLLDNAYKYTPAEKRIALRAIADPHGVTFVVQDNGIGIAPREQKRIFRQFYQVDRRLARETGGCGLGLSIVERIVRAHGGNVQVKSEVGAGSVFRVWLPAEAKG